MPIYMQTYTYRAIKKHAYHTLCVVCITVRTIIHKVLHCYTIYSLYIATVLIYHLVSLNSVLDTTCIIFHIHHTRTSIYAVIRPRRTPCIEATVKAPIRGRYSTVAARDHPANHFYTYTHIHLNTYTIL